MTIPRCLGDRDFRLGEAAAGERHERIGAMRIDVVTRPVLPDAADIVPFFPVGPEPLEAHRAALLIELAPMEERPGLVDGLYLLARAVHDARVEVELRHHVERAILQPQRLPVAVVRQVMLAPLNIVFGLPVLQPRNIMADELTAVFVVSDETMPS